VDLTLTIPANSGILLALLSKEIAMTNQYTYSPPFTEEELFDYYVNQEMSQSEIAVRFGVSQHVVQRAMKKMGVLTRKACSRNQKGSKNNHWKGGRVLVAKTKRQRGERTSFGNGYYYILDPEHPNANKSGYVAEHIVIATRKRGIPLVKGEVVHHINLNKHDNSPENLVVTSQRPHAIWHVQLEEIAVGLMNDGLVTFSSEHGYEWKGGDIK